jgi:hypothetical protein
MADKVLVSTTVLRMVDSALAKYENHFANCLDTISEVKFKLLSDPGATLVMKAANIREGDLIHERESVMSVRALVQDALNQEAEWEPYYTR